MGGFWGAEVEALRQQGSACGTAAGTVEALLGRCAGLIDGIEWIGTDADSFRERWSGQVKPLIEQMIEMLRADEHELNRHAEAQDEVSADGGGGGRVSLPGVPVPSFPFPVPSLPLPFPFPFPVPTIPRFEIPDCPVAKPELDVFEIGTLPILTLPRPPMCPSFPPPVTEYWPLPQPLPIPQPLPLPLPLPEPLPIPENWPLPQPLPQPLPIPDRWPMPDPLPRPDIYRL